MIESTVVFLSKGKEISFTSDNKVIKRFIGEKNKNLFENEVKVLRFLEEKGCDFVPKIISVDSENTAVVMTHCGTRLKDPNIGIIRQLFFDLESKYRVKHGDPCVVNVLYNSSNNKLYIIDFEVSTIINNV